MRIKISCKFILGWLIGCLVLSGCGQRTEPMEITGDTGVEAYSAGTYKKEVRELNLTPEHHPGPDSFQILGSDCYFKEVTYRKQDSGEEVTTQICRFGLSGEEQPEMLITLEEEQVLAYRVSADGNAGRRIDILTRIGGCCRLREYQEDGELSDVILLEDRDFVEANILFCWRKGTEFLAMGHYQLFVCNEQGEIVRELDCPGVSFQNGVLLGEDSLYVTYLDEDSRECRLARVNTRKGSLEDAYVIPGDGRLLAGDGQYLYTYAVQGIYRLDVGKKTADLFLDLTGFAGIAGERLWALGCRGECVEMISWDYAKAGKPVEYFTFSPKEEWETKEELVQASGDLDEQGRRIIRLYDPLQLTKLLIGDQIIRDFNVENDRYRLEIDSVQKDINTKLAGPDAPDMLLLLDSTDVEKYREQGYLEDLVPYLEKSEKVSTRDIQDFVFQCFGKDGGLYAIPRYGTLATLLGRQSQLETREGWTVKEFLTWLEEHPDLETEQTMSGETVLDYCLKGNFDQYVDLDAGKAFFDRKEFGEMLAGVKNLQLHSEQDRESNPLYVDPNKTYLLDQWISGVTVLAEKECIFGEELIFQGFPNDRGRKTAVWNFTTTMCIVSSSDCKEGAYAFLEYVLLYPQYKINSALQKEAEGEEALETFSGTIWSIKSLWEVETERALGEHTVGFVMPGATSEEVTDPEDRFGEITYQITEEHQALLLEMMSAAEADTVQKKTIRDIVQEEAPGYFQNQKELQTTCDVIQRRVQLYLDENE